MIGAAGYERTQPFRLMQTETGVLNLPPTKSRDERLSPMDFHFVENRDLACLARGSLGEH